MTLSFTRRFAEALSIVATLVMTTTTVVVAQGSVSLQGFGYPTGQLSTRAQGTAGALSEIDSRSPLNPAALVIGPIGQAYMQYDPEMRTVKGPTGSSKTTTARFPNVGFTVPLSKRLVAGASASTLLDRTWTTSATTDVIVGGSTETVTQTFRSDGGITDLRIAAGYLIGSRLRVGLGFHGYTGSNRVSILQQFADTLCCRSVSLRTVTSYGGNAFSGGAEFDIARTLNVAVSGRLGGTMNMYANDTLVSSGDVPDRFAASVSFGGIPQTLLAIRYAHEGWSSMQSMSTTGARTVDANDISAGVESAGPRVGERAILIRLGVRKRNLPFSVGTTDIDETSFGGGLGIPLGLRQLGGDRATLDFSVLRNSRTAVSGVSEKAYNFSVGLRIQP
jgi:hypothetical protein